MLKWNAVFVVSRFLSRFYDNLVRAGQFEHKCYGRLSEKAVLANLPDKKCSNPVNAMPHEEFTKLYTDNERGLFAFVYSLVPDRTAAEDIIQMTMTQLWENFEQYDAARPFFPWACRFAYRQILMHRRRETTRRKFFRDSTLELLSKNYPTDEKWKSREETRLSALRECMTQLTDRQQDLIKHRYFGETPIKELAIQLDQKVDALYKSLERTRKSLADCVQNKLASEGLS